jgi:hypothetical protein
LVRLGLGLALVRQVKVRNLPTVTKAGRQSVGLGLVKLRLIRHHLGVVLVEALPVGCLLAIELGG